MATQKDKMICPKCGDEMNHHADKLVYATPADAKQADNGLGGVIEETHCCPGCGAVESRRAG
jgi:ribosomal protein S27AE